VPNEEYENVFRTKEWRDYARHFTRDVLPKITDSAVTVSLAPGGKPDVQFCTELGFSIMLDKPIIAVVLPGRKAPTKLAQVADAVITIDPDKEPELFQRTMIDTLRRLGLE